MCFSLCVLFSLDYGLKSLKLIYSGVIYRLSFSSHPANTRVWNIFTLWNSKKMQLFVTSRQEIFLPFYNLVTIMAKQASIPAGNYTFKVNNRNTRTRCKNVRKCSKLTIKTPERHHWRLYGVFIVNFEHFSRLQLFLFNFETFRYFTKVSFRRKWNYAQLLLICALFHIQTS